MVVDQVCNISVNEFTGDKYTDDFGLNGSSISYNMKVELPTFYVLKRSNNHQELILLLHWYYIGCILILVLLIFYDVTIRRYGKDDYVVRYEQSIQDEFEASGDPDPVNLPVTYDREETIPIYERNTNVNVTIESNYDSPFTLYSLRWEGDYTIRYYQRV